MKTFLAVIFCELNGLLFQGAVKFLMLHLQQPRLISIAIHISTKLLFSNIVPIFSKKYMRNKNIQTIKKIINKNTEKSRIILSS